MIVRGIQDKKPKFGQRVWIAKNAVIIGDVVLEDDVNVWYGAVLRADLSPIRIGKRSNVQDNVVIHVDYPDVPTIVAEDVTIGHAAVLHGCRIERGALIGMNATVLNHAVIGEEAIVAAGALVPPGMHVPPRSLVAGVPAKVRGELKESDLEGMKRGVQGYLEMKSYYMADENEVEVEDAVAWEKLS